MATTLIALLLFAASTAFAQPMSLTVSPISIDHKIPLTDALAHVGISLQGGFVLFCIDIRTAPEPDVELKTTDPMPLGTVLAQVVGQVPGYGYRPISEHVVEVYSVKQSSEPTDVLNLHVDSFVVNDEPASNIFSKPGKFMPELKDYMLKGKTVMACGSIGPGLRSAGPGVTLELHGKTVRQILDAVSEADAILVTHSVKHDVPVGWVHRVGIDQQGEIVDMWSLLSTVPHGWERYITHPESTTLP